MLQVFVIALFTWIVSVLANVGNGFDSIAQTYMLKSKELDMVKIAEAMELYYREKGTMPPDLVTLATTPGYEYVASHLDGWQGYSSTSNLNDGTWTFKRFVAFAVDRSDGTTNASYLAQNYCGVSTFATETGSWCGTIDSRWYAVDTRKYFKPQLTTARVKVARLSMKFADYYNGNGAYPNTDAANNPLGASSITSIAALVGYGGTARNCSGQFQYKGIPIDCDDMFDLWGGLVGYQYEAPNHVIFVSESPIVNNSGNKVIVAVDRNEM